METAVDKERKEADREAEAVFRAFVDGKRVLIVDGSPAVRAGIAKVLKELGARGNLITLCPTFDDAMNEMATLRPHVLICDYHLDQHCGMRLFARQQELVPETDRRLSVLVTANARESTIAEAAEEDVDCYILKPFTLGLLREYLVRAACAKLRPNPYLLAIGEGKSLMSAGLLAQAEQVFWEARSISRSPSLAYYYHGRVCALRDMLDRAEASYRAGLKHNPLHYRCLTGLFDLLAVLPGGARDAEAYEVARRLFETFPVSARRLEAILRLVVRTRSFGAMDALGQLYDAVEARTPGLTRVMVAALVVSGIHYLMTPPPHPNYPIELFQRAITLSGRSSAVLREVITKLVDHGRHRDAQEFLRQFPAEVQRGADYQVMEFLVFSASGFAPRVVEHGRRLLHDGIDDPLLYEILIDRSIQVGHRDGADGLIYDAVKRYPELREKLFKRLSG